MGTLKTRLIMRRMDPAASDRIRRLNAIYETTATETAQPRRLNAIYETTATELAQPLAP